MCKIVPKEKGLLEWLASKARRKRTPLRLVALIGQLRSAVVVLEGAGQIAVGLALSVILSIGVSLCLVRVLGGGATCYKKRNREQRGTVHVTGHEMSHLPTKHHPDINE
jgi:hypothetical protein